MLTETIRAKLVARADAGVKKWGEQYFLGAISFIGVKRAGVNAVLRELKPVLPTDTDALWAEGIALLETPWMETRQVGIELLTKVRKKIGADKLPQLARVFDMHVHDWATCDGLAGRVLRELVKQPSAKPGVMAWAGAKNPWRQRASAVAFVNEAKHGAYDDDVIAVCTRIVKNPDRFVQLGCGWALRELSLHDRARVIAWIDDNAPHLSREGLRYATEKMPKATKQRVHAAHARKSGRGVRR